MGGSGNREAPGLAYSSSQASPTFTYWSKARVMDPSSSRSHTGRVNQTLVSASSPVSSPRRPVGGGVGTLNTGKEGTS